MIDDGNGHLASLSHFFFIIVYHLAADLGLQTTHPSLLQLGDIINFSGTTSLFHWLPPPPPPPPPFIESVLIITTTMHCYSLAKPISTIRGITMTTLYHVGYKVLFFPLLLCAVASWGKKINPNFVNTALVIS